MLRDEMREVLLSAALARRTVTYGYLMGRFGLARGSEGRSVVAVLGEIDAAEALAGAPGFAALVVRKDTGYPGGGFFCWEGLPASLRRPSERANDPNLSTGEMRYVRGQQERIWAYYREHAGGPSSSGQAWIDV